MEDNQERRKKRYQGPMSVDEAKNTGKSLTVKTPKNMRKKFGKRGKQAVKGREWRSKERAHPRLAGGTSVINI